MSVPTQAFNDSPPVVPRERMPLRRIVLWVVTVLVLIYLFVPIIVVVVFSFNAGRSLGVFTGFSFRWYTALAHDDNVIASLKASLEVAIVTTVVGTLLGSMLAIGLGRMRSRLAGPANVLLLLPLVAPEIVTAIALLILFSETGQSLSLTTVMLGHITFSIAYVTIIVRGRLALINPADEEAAMDLGSTNIGAILRVVVPALRPAILGSAFIVFVLSFDDFVTSYFVSGNGVAPLPVVIYSLIRYGVTPEINAIGTVMLALTLVLMALALLVAGRAYRGLRNLIGEQHG